jgi:D-alanine-D-alanine ligase
MPNRIKLALLYGGKSGEHEISLISAASILANLDPARYHITPVGIDKDGCFFVNDVESLRSVSGPLPVQTPTSKPLSSLLAHGRLAIEADVVFPVLHGPLYEDGCIQGLFELAGAAYVGAGVSSSAIGMDKDFSRRVVCGDGIQSTRYRRFSWMTQQDNLEDYCRETVAELGWPLFVKPCCMGSSVGIQKVCTMTALLEAIDDARRYDDEVLIEAFVDGREIELAVLENRNPHLPPKVSVPGEIRVHHEDGFYSYAAKYLSSEQTSLDIPAALSEATVLRLQQMSAEIFTRLKCRGMARVDFFVNEAKGEIYFSEINTLPGFTTISMYPKLWMASGLNYSALLDELIELALMYRQNKNQWVTSFL